MKAVVEFLNYKFDQSTWTYKKWTAIHYPIVFSIFGSMICLYYVFQMYKQNKIKNSQFAKHLQVRHKKLFMAHMLLCWYWIFPHPLITTFMIICDVSMEIVYCYGYFYLSLIFLIWGTRMWILYWDYSVSYLKIKQVWRKHIDDNSKSSFFLNHPTFGQISYVIIYVTPLIIIANIFIYFLAYITKFNELFHITGAIYLGILTTFLNILCIQLHRKHDIDNYYIRKEFTWLYLAVFITLTLLVIPYFIVTDNYIRVWIVGDGISFCCFITIPVTVKIILYQISSKNENELANYHKMRNNAPSKRIIQLLQDPTGINTFAEWLVGEFCVESLIFIIEICQFKTLLRKYIIQNHKHHSFNDSTSLYFEIANNIPTSQTIELNTTDKEYDYVNIAHTITKKFIEDEYSEMSVNLSYEQRQRLSTITFDEYDHIQLYSVFDEAFREILKLLRDPFRRFSLSSKYKKILALQGNNIKTNNIAMGNRQKTVAKTLDDKLHMILYNVAQWMNYQCFNCCFDIDKK